MNELKSEIRRPKSERNPKIEIRKPKRFRISEWRIFGLRSSDFFRISTFGFRILLGLAFPLSAQTNILYQNDFQQASLGKLPEDFLVLDGAFTVKEENGNKFMELPGAPLDSFAVQFGPAEASDISVSGRIRSTAKGRRFPTFGVGLNGVAGYRLQVSPAKKQLELYRDQQLKASVPFEWKSGEWTNLRLQVRQTKAGEWKVEGKTWTQGATEPGKWDVTLEEKQRAPDGRASVFGSPFSGTPIQFDDLIVRQTRAE